MRARFRESIRAGLGAGLASRAQAIGRDRDCDRLGQGRRGGPVRDRLGLAGQARLDLAADSVAICPELLEVAPDAVVLIVANPIDWSPRPGRREVCHTALNFARRFAGQARTRACPSLMAPEPVRAPAVPWIWYVGSWWVDLLLGLAAGLLLAWAALIVVLIITRPRGGPCQNSHNASELVFSELFRPLSDTR